MKNYCILNVVNYNLAGLVKNIVKVLKIDYDWNQKLATNFFSDTIFNEYAKS